MNYLKYLFGITTVIIYTLFNHCTCKIIHKNIDTHYGFSSMLVYAIPLFTFITNNTLTYENYTLIYIQSLISFYYNVIRQQKTTIKYWPVIYTIDTSFITIFPAKYLAFPPKYIYSIPLINFIIHTYFPNSELHSCLFAYSIFHVFTAKPHVIPFILPGMLAQSSLYINTQYETLLHKYLWHFSCGVAISQISF
uniref:Uncharacterized protein n=1 Tax=viral metagenome TaxID=1070528 RepID=A0A6C0F7X0_9ZZZZ